MASEPTARVTSVSWQGIRLDWYGEPDEVSWRKLVLLSQSGPAEHRPVYVELLRQALALAAAKKMVRVYCCDNFGRTTTHDYTWAAHVTDPASNGMADARRLLGADWGQQGWPSDARREVEEAAEKLRAAGYDVRRVALDQE